jgi:hypothetical protein
MSGWGPNSEVAARNRQVRFPPDSDQTADIAGGPFRANSGSPLSPSVARHALAGVRARDDGELAFESRSEQDAAERRPIGSNRWEADFRRRRPIYSTVTINLLKPRRVLFSARSSTSTWKRVTLRASAVNSARISSLARFMPRHAWGPAPNAM